MKRAFLTFFALILVDCASSSKLFPPPTIPKKPTAAEFPDAGAAILEDEATLDYRTTSGVGDPQHPVAVLTHRRRIKILSKEGLAHSVIDLPVDAYSTVTRIDAQSVGPDGDVTPWDRDDLDIGTWPNLPPHPDLKILRVKVPDAKVGGLVDISYERVFVDIDLIPPWVFSQRLPVLRSIYSVVANQDMKVDIRTGIGNKVIERDPLRRTTADGRDRLVYVENDLKPIHYEPSAPHDARIGPWVATVMTASEVGGQRQRMASWEDVRRKVESMFALVDAPAESGPSESRYARVRDALRDVDVRGLATIELAAASPQPADTLMSGTNPACTRDAAAVLAGAMAGADLPAYPALISSPVGPPLLEGFPAMYPFVRAVVAVDVTSRVASDPTCTEDPESRGLLCSVARESYAFVDPMCKYCRFGELPSELTGGRALVFLPDKSRWVDVPIDQPERNRTLTEFRYVFEVDGRIHGNMAGDTVGAVARNFRKQIIDGMTGEQTRELVSQMLTGGEGELKYVKASISDIADADKPLRLRGTVETRAQKEDDELYTTRIIDFAGPALPGRFRSLRRYDVLLEAPAWLDTNVQIDLPVGYAVGDMPPEIRISKDFAEYASGFVTRDKSLFFSRRLVIRVHQLDAEQYEEFREFLDEIATAEGAAMRVGLVEAPPAPQPEPKKGKGRRRPR